MVDGRQRVMSKSIGLLAQRTKRATFVHGTCSYPTPCNLQGNLLWLAHQCWVGRCGLWTESLPWLGHWADRGCSLKHMY